jgi:SAM-dependent methyltransferase
VSTRDVYGRPPRRIARPAPRAPDAAVSRRSLLRLDRRRAELDYADLTARVRAAWQREGHGPLLRQLEPAAAAVTQLLALEPDERFLDVGAGDGNLALAAAGAGAAVSACDIAPRMVEAGRSRTAAHSIDWSAGDVQELPYPDASFDAVASTFGADLAPNAARAASELVRVVRPGGRIALASWIPRGLPGRLDELSSRWGIETVVRRRLEGLLNGLQLRTRTLPLSFPSADAAFAALTRSLPLDDDRLAELRPGFERLLASCNNQPPGVQIDARYLIVLGARPD